MIFFLLIRQVASAFADIVSIRFVGMIVVNPISLSFIRDIGFFQNLKFKILDTVFLNGSLNETGLIRMSIQMLAKPAPNIIRLANVDLMVYFILILVNKLFHFFTSFLP